MSPLDALHKELMYMLVLEIFMVELLKGYD